MVYRMLTWLADDLRKEGCKVREYPGWRTRGRPASTGAFAPYGVLWHHTGSRSSYSNPAPTLRMCVQGRSDLPGPLCQVVIGYDGTCHVIAAGRANHAGRCSGFGPFSTGDANWQLVGFEIDYDGTQPMSPQQKDAATRASAACLRRFGHGSLYAARHAETSITGKWDTGGVTGTQLRLMIRRYMDSGTPPKPPTPNPEDDMALSKEDKEWINQAIDKGVKKYVGDVVTVPKDDPNYDPDNPKIYVYSALQWLLGRSETDPAPPPPASPPKA